MKTIYKPCGDCGTAVQVMSKENIAFCDECSWALMTGGPSIYSQNYDLESEFAIRNEINGGDE